MIRFRGFYSFIEKKVRHFITVGDFGNFRISFSICEHAICLFYVMLYHAYNINMNS